MGARSDGISRRTFAPKATKRQPKEPKEGISAEIVVISFEMRSFGQNNLIISCRKRLILAETGVISAEMEYFGRNADFCRKIYVPTETETFGRKPKESPSWMFEVTAPLHSLMGTLFGNAQLKDASFE